MKGRNLFLIVLKVNNFNMKSLSVMISSITAQILRCLLGKRSDALSFSEHRYGWTQSLQILFFSTALILSCLWGNTSKKEIDLFLIFVMRLFCIMYGFPFYWSSFFSLVLCNHIFLLYMDNMKIEDLLWMRTD